ncbi:hypothetical protein SADUNF_SadunfMtG0002900 (mitochondrion) [Salix dunnii]|uniref:Uncharacterized protein n=1 Tax=Salix dunnii TaxID=1413687 RepID=A0A835J2A6_9ROSI|nr:hypothetical protein SADUNF_SadunfMtG0002900 [Salix dunnii]
MRPEAGFAGDIIALGRGLSAVVDSERMVGFLRRRGGNYYKESDLVTVRKAGKPVKWTLPLQARDGTAFWLRKAASVSVGEMIVPILQFRFFSRDETTSHSLLLFEKPMESLLELLLEEPVLVTRLLEEAVRNVHVEAPLSSAGIDEALGILSASEVEGVLKGGADLGLMDWLSNHPEY